MRKVLVTGATGFLGSNLVRLFHTQGFDVRIIVRPGAHVSVILGTPCEIVYGHIDNRGDVANAIKGCSVVIHAASITEQWGIDYATYERINITATKYIVDECIEQRVEKMIYVSTANTIGPGTLQHPGNEMNGFTLFNVNSGYINSKYLAQQYVLEQAERKGLHAVVVNPTFMIGPNDVKPSSGTLLLYSLGKRILFYPPGGKNFVHIKDVCQGIINAIDKGKKGNCYLLAGGNLSYKAFFKMLSNIAGEKKIMIRVPGIMLKTLGLIGSALQSLLIKNVRLTYGAAYLLCLGNYYTGRKSERELSLQYTSIETATTEAYEWFKENGYIK